MKPKYGSAALGFLLATTLTGCSTPQLAKLPVCDGKDRRTANPYGVTLPGVPETARPQASPPSAAARTNINVFGGAGDDDGDSREPSGETVPALRQPDLSAYSPATYRRC
ncbi:hypothetical protein [Erythrobacter sp. QSSC1-22B]|uniref:hypothetical protein n=1 Tax=Erythrobacter sp. QSSC1-22B TaxID=1860125 RepID=UPI00119FC500|nr:hypothetical protein [Erythrobacter sp. QSSC1-22B]